MNDDHRQSKSFTRSFSGRAKVLEVDVGIGEPSQLGPEDLAQPTFTNFLSVWDTGATNSVISRHVIDTLKLKPTGKAQVMTSAGTYETDSYLVNIYLPNRVYFPGVRVTEGQLRGAHVLIGMDIISTGDFSVTNKDGQTCLSFRVPSIRKIDYVDDFKRAFGPKTPEEIRRGRNRRKRERQHR